MAQTQQIRSIILQNHESTWIVNQKFFEIRCKTRVNTVNNMKLIELHIESVFFGRYQSVFLCIYHSDTDGKLGRWFRYQKGGSGPLPTPLLEKKEERKGGEMQKRGERYRPKILIPSQSDTGEIPIPKKWLEPQPYRGSQSTQYVTAILAKTKSILTM